MRHLPVICLAAALGVAAVSHPQELDAQAATPTFTKDVAPILFKNCTSCHRPQGLGPMPLLTYQDARKAADDIADVVSSGHMPPWHADAPRGTFHNDRRLTETEKQTILKWVAGDTPQGNARDLPKAPEYPTGWTIGSPDAVITMPTPYTVPAKGVIEYQYFEVPTNFTEDKFVQAIEILPGAREVVHHVLVYARPPGPPPPQPPPGTPTPPPLLIRRPDHDLPRDPAPDAQPRRLGALLATTAPGTNVQIFPQGTRLASCGRFGDHLPDALHRARRSPGHRSHERRDGVRARRRRPSRFAPHPSRTVSFESRRERLTTRCPQRSASVTRCASGPCFPHTHLRGKRWEYRLVKPDGSSSVILVGAQIRFQLADVLLLHDAPGGPGRVEDREPRLVRQLPGEPLEPRCHEGSAMGRSDVGGDAVHRHALFRDSTADGQTPEIACGATRAPDARRRASFRVPRAGSRPPASSSTRG